MSKNMKTENKMEEIIEILKNRDWTIGVMESCTGGAVANCITNIPGASDVFECGLVTYCDEAKIKAGVDEKIIKKYGVYSTEVAEEMAREIGILMRVNVGIGVTGTLPGKVFISVRVGKKIKSIEFKVESKNDNKIEARKEMKKEVVEKIIKLIIDSI